MGVPRSVAYQQVVVTRHMATVVEAPDLALMSAELLRALDSVYFAGADLLYIGDLEDGSKVYYRIVGWDTEQKALVIQREPMAPVATRTRDGGDKRA